MYSIGGVGLEIEIKGYTVIIDDSDYDLIKGFSWRVCKKEEKQGLIYFHAATKRDPITHEQKDVRLHRLKMGCTVRDGVYVDHINHNTLDNRKCNLRKTNAGGNVRNSRKGSRNTSGYKGVSYIKRDNLYQAGIKLNGISYNAGRASTPDEAAKLYDMAAIKMFGEYACLNFPENTYSQEEIDRIYNAMTDSIYSSNTSGYRGVSWNNNKLKWSASIQKDKITYYLGTHATPEIAARVRDRKAIELYGEKAILNFPIETYKENSNEQEATN